jgi:hypothetical protein
MPERRSSLTSIHRVIPWNLISPLCALQHCFYGSRRCVSPSKKRIFIRNCLVILFTYLSCVDTLLFARISTIWSLMMIFFIRARFNMFECFAFLIVIKFQFVFVFLFVKNFLFPFSCLNNVSVSVGAQINRLPDKKRADRIC